MKLPTQHHTPHQHTCLPWAPVPSTSQPVRNISVFAKHATAPRQKKKNLAKKYYFFVEKFDFEISKLKFLKSKIFGRLFFDRKFFDRKKFWPKKNTFLEIFRKSFLFIEKISIENFFGRNFFFEKKSSEFFFENQISSWKINIFWSGFFSSTGIDL